MGIIAAVPFQVGQGGELFLSKESGFHAVNQTLKELGEKTAAGQPDMVGVDAIPSCIAHLKKMHSDMDNEGFRERYNEERWRKVMVIYVLSKYRAYNIYIDVITPESCSRLAWNIFGKKLAEETGMGDCIYMLQVQGEDIAVFDCKGYLLPIAQLPFHMEKELGENCIDSLEEYEKRIMLSFLQGLLQNTMVYQSYIKSFIRSLESCGTKPIEQSDGLCVSLKSMDTMPVLGNAMAHKYFQSIPQLPIELPGVFHPKLVLAITESLAGSINSFGKECSFQFRTATPGGPLYFSGFLPLAEKMVDFLENNDEVHLRSVQVDSSEFEEECRIRVRFLFTIGREKIALSKCYGQKDIIYADSVPMVSLFPYVKLPQECWKSYYLVLIRNKVKSDAKVEALEAVRKIEGQNIDLAEASWSRSTEAGREEDRQLWYYSSRERMPRFVKLCEADFERGDEERNAAKAGSYIGCICTGTPQIIRTKEKRNYVWALDMGTRNTIAAYKEKNVDSIFYRLSRDQIYCSLLFGMGDKGRNFARECYAPVQEIYGSFPTMARIYKEGRQNGGIKCYEHGCALFPDLELMEMLLNKDANWNEAAILTDIKFGRNDKAHETALQIFLFNMLWLGSLECALNGADTLEVRISYPKSDIRKRIEKTWDVVIGMMRDVTNMGIRLSYCSEAEANARYLQKIMRDNPVYAITPEDIFGICDIGDGTSDFNLYLGTSDNNRIPDRIQFSMRYAGGDILVDTILKFSERWQECFQRLWNIPEDSEKRSQDNRYKKADSLLTTYQKLLLLRRGYGKVEDSDETQGQKAKNIGMKYDKLKAGIQPSMRNVVLTLIESVGLRRNLTMSPEEPIKDFTAVLSFKYWNLFHVYGEMLKKFRPDGVVSFKLFFYGGGRKALEYATGVPLNRFKETEFGRDILSYLSEQANIDKAGFSLHLEENTDLKIEVVEGMLEEVGVGTINSKVYSSGEEIDGYFKDKCEEKLPGKVIDETQMKALLHGYEEYIQSVKGKQYFELCEGDKAENIFEAISVGSYDEDNYSLFRKKATDLWHEITADKDNPQCLWEVLFYTKMSNYLLMENIW